MAILKQERRVTRNAVKGGRYALLCGWALFVGVGMLGSLSVEQAVFASETAVDSPLSYARDIRPILAANCFQCHGPDEATRAADLRLDDADAAYADLGGCAAVSPGDPENSELVRRILAEDEAERMPPSESGKALTKEQIDLLQRWVAEGGKYEQHWAFVPPKRPALPQVKDQAWPRNEIDHFVLARLEQNGLRPSPEADRYELVRRVYLDLIGLPPLPSEADEFVHDQRADAYERLVEQLLNSPHYGERWARRWLDLARYSDTKGYEKDQPRTMWLYRDWVINALNADMPFNQFTLEQLAGDMLPRATLEQRIATGFHRNTMTNEEGGIDPQEFRFQALVDRVATTGTTWLGLTIGCAQCHTHKYDPISHTDYYRLFAILNNADDLEVEVPQPQPDEQRQEIERRIQELTDSLAKDFPVDQAVRETSSIDPQATDHARDSAIEREFGEWQTEQSKRAIAWRQLRPVRVESNLPTLQICSDKSILASGDVTKNDTYRLMFDVGDEAVTAIRLEVLPESSLPDGGPGRQTVVDAVGQLRGNFYLSEISARLCDTSGHVVAPLGWADASASFVVEGLAANHAIDGRSDTGWTVFGREGERHTAVYCFREAVVVPPNQRMNLELQHESLYPAAIGCLRISVTSAKAPHATGFPQEIDDALLTPSAERTSQQISALRAYFLQSTPLLAAKHAKIAELKKSLPRRPTALVLGERAINPRQTHRHHRGEYLKPAEAVSPGLPQILTNTATGTIDNRLEFARWLTTNDNPLVARVAINRAWQALIGRGLVSTTEDFGYQGSYPSHPELLDWLATEFVRRSWSMKEMHRLIVSSATYRQSSNSPAAIRERDPENLWCSRGPRQRVEAEIVRDSILRASGQLTERVGGPSVFPPQPPGITEAAYKPMVWQTSSGEDRYRRGLYTFNKRTAPYAAFTLFDAPSGEACVARRNLSNTPLQALALLNDEVVLDAARHLARACLREGGDDATVAENIFRRCLTRPPSREELDDILAYVKANMTRFQSGQNNASRVLQVEPKLIWSFPKDSTAWQARHDCTLSVTDTCLVLESTGADPFIGAQLSAPAGRYTLRLRGRFETHGKGEVFWTSDAAPLASPERRAEFTIRPGQWHDYEIPLTSADALTSLRLDLGESAGKVKLEKIALLWGEGQFDLASYEDPNLLAAWTLMARAMMNLDEMITKP